MINKPKRGDLIRAIKYHPEKDGQIGLITDIGHVGLKVRWLKHDDTSYISRVCVEKVNK